MTEAPDFTEDRVRPFRFWIQGYQNFYEPLVAAYFEAHGYKAKRPAVVSKAELQALADALFDGRKKVGSPVDVKRVIEHLRRRTGLQADMLVEDDSGAYLVECKSWGGFAEFGEAAVRATFVGDPRNAAFLLLDRARGRDLAGKILVLSSPRDEQIDHMLGEIFRTSVRTLHLNDVLRDPAIRSSVESRLKYLDAAVAAVREALLPGEGGPRP